jgi:hydrogenase expression/formation protein HypC
MCLAIPSRVVGVADGFATVECFGIRRVASLILLDEELAVGDYVLVQAGGYAYEKVDTDRALEALALMQDIVASTHERYAA